MCGRYAFYLPPSKLQSFFGLENLLNLPPRYNCAPMQRLPIIVKNRAGFARWGFRPEWSKEDNTAMASKMINARSETVFEKASFRGSWEKGRRCIVPANGFFEWKKNEKTGANQPYFVHHQEEEIMCMAGLWSKVDDQVTFTILTKQADGEIANIHHRMPVMFKAADVSNWFLGSLADASDMVSAASADSYSFHEVSADVGKVSNDSADLVEPLKVA